MDRFGKRGAALLLAASLLLGLLAGCGKRDDTQQLSATVYVPQYIDAGVNVDYIRDGCTDGEYIYLVGYVSEQTEEKDPETGDVYYSYTENYDIYRVSLSGGAAEKLPGYVGPSVPEGKSGNAYVEDIRAASDGTLWVRETTYIWGDYDEKYPDVEVMPRAEAGTVDVEEAEEETADDEETADAEDDIAADDIVDDDIAVDPGYYGEDQETVVLRQLDGEGNELSRIEVTNLQDTLADVLDEGAYVNTISFDSDGNIYAVTGEKIYVLDARLDLLYTLEGEDLWAEMTQLSDGTMGMLMWDYDEETETQSKKLLTIDPAKQDWGPTYDVPVTSGGLYPGGGDYLFYYAINDAVFGYKAGEPDAQGVGTGEAERLFSWIEADVDRSNVRDFFFLPDGRVAAISQAWDDSGKGRAIVNIVIMTATPREELPEKTTLVYATLYLTYDARAKIIDFNKKSDKYRIEVRDYGEYDTDYSGTASLQKLNTEILAGTVPDILDTSSLPVRIYGSKGILEDLWPFIENDPDLGRDALMTRPLEANEQEGKLYEIFNGFSIRTVTGATKAVGDRMSWTLADLQAALSDMPEGCSIFGVDDTRDNMLSSVLAMNMDQFVDWSTGKCSFDSEDFKALLSFCNSFPAEFKWEEMEWEEEEARLLTGKQLLAETNLYGFDGWDYQRIMALFPDGYSFVGYPKEDGSCGSSFSIGRGIAMTSTCKDKEGAWSFIRDTLLPQMEDEDDWYYYGNFPINKSDFDLLMAKSLEPQYQVDENGDILLDDDGQPVLFDPGTMWISEDVELPMRNITQADVDQLMALYNTVDSVLRYDEKIYNAVQEVASQYFAGDKPLDDAANLIQSKVTLYVNESR